MDRGLSQLQKRRKPNESNLDKVGIIGKSKSELKKRKKKPKKKDQDDLGVASSGASNTVFFGVSDVPADSDIADTILASGTDPSRVLKTLDGIIPKSETEAEIKENAKRYWALMEWFHELYGVYPWEVVHTLHPKDRIPASSNHAQPKDDAANQEKDYVKKQRKLKKITKVKFSVKDIKKVESIVQEAKVKGQQIAPRHEQFISAAEKRGLITPQQAGAARFMLRYMNTLNIIGVAIREAYDTLDVAGTATAQEATHALARFIGEELQENFQGIGVNALLAGGTYSDWTRIDHLSNYLNMAIATFSQIFDMAITAKNGPMLSRLIQILNSGEWNIEKYISAMNRTVLAQATDPYSKLRNALADLPTSGGGRGRGLLTGALNYLHEQFLRANFTDAQIIGYEYTHTVAQFRNWFIAQGFTYQVIRQAVADERRDQTTTLITDQEIDDLLQSYDES